MFVICLLLSLSLSVSLFLPLGVLPFLFYCQERFQQTRKRSPNNPGRALDLCKQMFGNFSPQCGAVPILQVKPVRRPGKNLVEQSLDHGKKKEHSKGKVRNPGTPRPGAQRHGKGNDKKPTITIQRQRKRSTDMQLSCWNRKFLNWKTGPKTAKSAHGASPIQQHFFSGICLAVHAICRRTMSIW